MFEKLESMDKRTLVRLAIAVVLGLLVFGAIAGGIRQAGWNEGFMIGQLASSGGDGAQAIAPQLGYHGSYGVHRWGGHGFGLIGGFFRFLFFGFLIMLAFKFFAFRRWGMHRGGPGGWHGGWHGDRGQHGPWGEPQNQQPGQPQQTTPAAGAAPQPDENKPQNTSWTNV